MQSTDYQELVRVRGTYAPLRRLYQVTLRTDAGRQPHSAEPLTWSVDVTNSQASVGELKVVRDSPIAVEENGLPVQLLVWTLWGGDHSIEFDHVDVTLRVRLLE